MNVLVFLGLSRDQLRDLQLRELENMLKHYSLSRNSVKNCWHKYVRSIFEIDRQEGKEQNYRGIKEPKFHENLF